MGVVGVGMQIYGAFSGSENARKASQINQEIAADEGRINEQKRQSYGTVWADANS